MKAYLLTWNPKYWPWDNINKEIKSLQSREYFKTEWDCYSRNPKKGDIFFIVALGESQNKGIFCSGYINKLLLGMPSLIKDQKNTKRNTNRLIGNINSLLNPKEGNILDIEHLKNNFPDQKWTPRNCGIEIKDWYVNDLIVLWENIIEKNINYKDKIKRKEFWEGNLQQKLYTGLERNTKARNECINIYGYSCKICGTNFEKIYGDIGENFIHVHHMKFHSSIKNIHKIDPETELITVCPNCHSMLHKKMNEKYLSIEELKKRVKK